MLPKLPIIALLSLSLFTIPSSYAHDVSKHKGKPLKGEVLSLEGDTLTVKSHEERGEQKVTLNQDTKFEKGDEDASRADVVKGDE